MDRRLTAISGFVFLAIWLACAYGSFGAELGRGFTYAVFGTLGLVFAAGLAFPKLASGFARAVEAPKTWVFLLVTSLVALGITLWLALDPMRGMPASLDGSVYVFQARALANLSYGHPIPPPRLPFGLRFLFEGADGNMHGVFPIGLPLYLAPFLALGSLHLGLAALTVAMVLVQYAVTKALTKTELVARASVLLTLPSWGRAVETAEPVSHTLVAICVGVVLVLTLKLPTSRKPFRLALLLGAAAAWAFIARLLDGFILGFVFAPLLLFWAATKRIPRSTIAAIVLGGLPFLAVIFGQQYAATGNAFEPNVTEYAVRSDWPPTCLRLGIGKDIGCRVEHPHEAESFGPDGYQLDDFYRLVRERAEVYGFDLVGSGLLFLLAFVPLLVRNREEPSEADEDALRRTGLWLTAGFVLALTVGYGLYYYGNHPIWGARHLFASAPLAFALIALAAERFAAFAKGRPVAPAFTLALLTAVCVSAWPMWERGLERVRHDQTNRIDLRALIEDHGVERGVIATLDTLGVLNGYDPWTDGDRRFLVLDGPHGFHDLRRLHPSLPVYLAQPPASLVRVEPEPLPTNGFFIELERAWPSFQRPSGLGATGAYAKGLFDVHASSAHALYVFESKPSAKLTIPIWVPRSGRYTVRVHMLQGPDFGDYKLMLDDHVLPLHRGYHPEYRRVATPESVPIELSEGRHLFVAECLGKHRESGGYRAVFDTLSGVMVDGGEEEAAR